MNLQESKEKVFLTATDTTIGFLSKDSKSLDRAKKRAPNKYYIKAIPSFKSLTKRVPKAHKNLVRRAKKTTFIINKDSFRVVKDKKHLFLLNRLGYAYTSSANESGKEYNFDYASKAADVLVYPLHSAKASTIIKLGKKRKKRLR
jgi:tRNA A37 threonylcarbamoyladenosine synthetase subunit TsaC/SUA5/YrdC